jgi:hypothetical protein
MLRRKNNKGLSSTSAKKNNKRGFIQNIPRNPLRPATYIRRLTLPGTVIPTSASGVINITSVTSDSVRSGAATEWASLSARFEMFRVRKIFARWVPVWPKGSNVFGSSAIANHGQFFVGTNIGGTSTNTIPAILASIDGRVFSTSDYIRYEADASINLSAKLWTPVGSAIAALSQFGITAGSAAAANTTLVVSTDYFTVYNEWEVEFMGDL